MQGHEVVFQIQVCKVLAVEELRGQLLQTAAGQVDGAHPLGRDLTETGRLVADRLPTGPEEVKATFEAVLCQRRCSVYES